VPGRVLPSPGKRSISAGLCVALSLLPCAEASAAGIVAEWNTIAASTIVTGGGKPAPASGVWFAYASVAVYDAVNAVDRRFEPFYYRGFAPRGASDEAAAIAAAHRVLVVYFPAQQPALDAQYRTSLDNIRAGGGAKAAGVAAGESAAAALIAARAGDGLEADVPYTAPAGTGFWQPAVATLPAVTPWLGEMRPFTMTSAAEFLPPGPPPLSSDTWVADYNEVRALGGTVSSMRTPKQTETAWFWTEHPSLQYARVFSYLAGNDTHDVMASARLMAILWTSYADAVIGCFNAKYHYGFWRPNTAIPAGGGNPSLVAERRWSSLAMTPNHPEYPSGHGCMTGATAASIERYFGTDKLPIVVESHVFRDGIHVHTFASTRDLLAEVFDARICAGFHYKRSLEDGAALGTRVTERIFQHYFRPLDR
jgi:PAP2 superfamily